MMNPAVEPLVPFPLFEIAGVDMEYVRAVAAMGKVKMLGTRGLSPGGFDIMMIGPERQRLYSERDLTPLTTETLLSAIKHVAETLP